MAERPVLSDRLSLDHKMVCWECRGSGVMAKDRRAVPCEVCKSEYGELVVVPKREVERLRETLREVRDRWAFPKLIEIVDDALDEERQDG